MKGGRAPGSASVVELGLVAAVLLLLADQLRIDAVVRNLEIIGEAATKVSSGTRDRSPEIPWPAIVTMRHRLIHGYFDVDPDIVWRTATEEVPALIPPLRDLAASD